MIDFIVLAICATAIIWSLRLLFDGQCLHREWSWNGFCWGCGISIEDVHAQWEQSGAWLDENGAIDGTWHKMKVARSPGIALWGMPHGKRMVMREGQCPGLDCHKVMLHHWLVKRDGRDVVLCKYVRSESCTDEEWSYFCDILVLRYGRREAARLLSGPVEKRPK